MKIDDGGQRDPGWIYSRYHPDRPRQDGHAGLPDQGDCSLTPARCDSAQWVANVNRTRLCGTRLATAQTLCFDLPSRDRHRCADHRHHLPTTRRRWVQDGFAYGPDLRYGMECLFRLGRSGGIEQTDRLFILAAGALSWRQVRSRSVGQVRQRAPTWCGRDADHPFRRRVPRWYARQQPE